MVNTIVLEGYLTGDPKIIYQQDDKCIVVLPLVHKSNLQKEEDFFVDVKVFDGLASTCAKHLKKGRKIVAEGVFKVEKWSNKQGELKTSFFVKAHNIVFGDIPRSSQNSESQGSKQESKPKESPPPF